jgi:hypothetical protein
MVVIRPLVMPAIPAMDLAAMAPMVAPAVAAVTVAAVDIAVVGRGCLDAWAHDATSFGIAVVTAVRGVQDCLVIPTDGVAILGVDHDAE